MNPKVDLQLLAVLLAGGALAVSTAVLFVGWRILRNIRRSERAGNERLEILREQQERLRLMHQEREMLQEELKRLLSAMGEEDAESRLRELPAPSEQSASAREATREPRSATTSQQEPAQPRSWWQRMFGS